MLMVLADSQLNKQAFTLIIIKETNRQQVKTYIKIIEMDGNFTWDHLHLLNNR